MKVSQAFCEDEDYGNASYSLTMTADSGEAISFCDMCQEPEDNSYYRDHRDVRRLPEFIRAAYEAGRRGEGLTIEEPTSF